ncbi:MAG: hypothetical protein OMM_12430, partial [Candidatus Magnetoglobus multicellularis str. Araruama]
RSLKSQVSELKGRMLELVVWRKMNQYRRKGQTISFLKNKLRAIPEDLKNHSRLAIVDSMTIRMIYLNYYIQSPETGPLELDVLVEGMSDHTYHAVLFEIKNRDEKNLPSEKDLQLFVQKIELFTYALTRQGFENIVLCPVYFSANGFDNDSEKWLHEHHIYTADMVSWKIDE